MARHFLNLCGLEFNNCPVCGENIDYRAALDGNGVVFIHSGMWFHWDYPFRLYQCINVHGLIKPSNLVNFITVMPVYALL